MPKRLFMIAALLMASMRIYAQLAQPATNLTDAELEPVTKHAIKGRRLQEDVAKLQTLISAMPEYKKIQEESKRLQEEEAVLSKQILKAHKLDDGKHVVDFQQGRIVEQQPAPQPKPEGNK